MLPRLAAISTLLLLLPGGPLPVSAFSVLSHEAIIDSAWERNVKPLLLKRFPDASPDDLVKAHAYAYGGCILQDMGYYPFGSKFFSNLVHYVRSGDFVMTMIDEAQDLNEYAFALGTLAHYTADTEGHPEAVNLAVAIEYPKLAREFGPKVTYEQNPVAHLKVEFGFDVLEVAQGHFAPQSYRDFIGFQVSKPLLERAFRDCYALQLNDVFMSVDLALGTYRRTVSELIPESTRIAWLLKKDEIVKMQPGVTSRKFIYNLSRASYEKEWGRDYKKPGIGARILAFFFRILPKVGPFKAAAFKAPTDKTAKLFMASFNRTLDQYRKYLADVGANRLQLPNRNFDTGEPTRAADYGLADETYAKLARTLAKKDPNAINPKLRANILEFYSKPGAKHSPKIKPKEWSDTLAAVEKLRAVSTDSRPPAQ
jgi:zinc dependent phospholipase C